MVGLVAAEVVVLDQHLKVALKVDKVQDFDLMMGKVIAPEMCLQVEVLGIVEGYKV